MSTLRPSAAWFLGIALAAGCGDGTPDAKTAGDVATVEVQALPDSPDSPPPAPDPSVAPDPPEQETKVAGADPPAPAAPAPGPSAPSGGTAKFTTASRIPTQELQALAATDAVGMLPSGSTLSATFAQGDTLELPLLLQPGRCYTILAAGAPTVQATQISMSASVPMLPPALLAQVTGASVAALGGRGAGCYKNPMPIAMMATVTVQVTTGKGSVSVQVYSK